MNGKSSSKRMRWIIGIGLSTLAGVVLLPDDDSAAPTDESGAVAQLAVPATPVAEQNLKDRQIKWPQLSMDDLSSANPFMDNRDESITKSDAAPERQVVPMIGTFGALGDHGSAIEIETAAEPLRRMIPVTGVFRSSAGTTHAILNGNVIMAGMLLPDGAEVVQIMDSHAELLVPEGWVPPAPAAGPAARMGSAPAVSPTVGAQRQP